MFRLKVSKVMVAGVMMAGGLFAAVAPASAATFGAKGCPSGTPCVIITPSSGLTTGETVTVMSQNLGVEGVMAGSVVAVVECNSNLESMDPDSCDQNANKLGHPGGPEFATTSAKHGVSIVVQYTVRISSTQEEGDGFCAPGGNGGQPCFLVVGNPGTGTALGEAPFTTE